MNSVWLLLTIIATAACWKRGKALNWYTLEEGIFSPEGIETGDNKIYITTNSASGGGLLVLNDAREELARYSFPGTSFVTGVGYNPVNGYLFVGDASGKIFRVKQTTGEVSQVQNLGPNVFPNDWIFDSAGNVYMTASQAGRIYRMDKEGRNPEVWLEDDSFKVQPFGVNGITWDDEGKYLYAAITSSNVIMRFPVKKTSSGKMEKDGEGSVWASAVYSPDGLYFDEATKYLWICNNAVNQVMALDTADGSVVQVAGDFDGIANGQAVGLLQPASIAKWGQRLLVTNLGGDFGDVNAPFTSQLTRWNVVSLKAATRGFRPASTYGFSQ